MTYSLFDADITQGTLCNNRSVYISISSEVALTPPRCYFKYRPRLYKGNYLDWNRTNLNEEIKGLPFFVL